MANEKKGPCWSTLITTTIAVLCVCSSVMGVLLNMWIAPKEKDFENQISLLKRDVKQVEKNVDDIKSEFVIHKIEDKEILKKVDESIDKYRTESNNREKETKELLTELRLSMVSLTAATEYIKETLKEMKKTKQED